MPPSTTPGRARSASRGDAAPIVDDEEAAAKKKRVNRHAGRGRDARCRFAGHPRMAPRPICSNARIASTPPADWSAKSKREMNKQQRGPLQHGQVAKPTHVEIIPPVTIRASGRGDGRKIRRCVEKLMARGVMATVNQIIEPVMPRFWRSSLALSW